MSRAERIAAELARLHRGRGIDADRMDSRIGPELRQVLYGDQVPAAELARPRLRTLLERTSSLLPEEDRRLVHDAFGLRPGARLFEARVVEISMWMDRSPRVVKRRLEVAELALAETIARKTTEVEPNPYAQRGWYVDEMVSHAYLSDPATQFYAVRTICATTTLSEVTDSFTIPDGLEAGEDIEMHGLEGCADLRVTRVNKHTWQYRAVLTTRLTAGSLHVLGLRIVLPAPHHMRPWNAIVPLRDTRRFVAVVHHTAEDGVTAAWRHDGVPAAVMQDGRDVGVPLPVELGTPLRAEWEVVRRGLAYGVAWAHDA